jgi:hypothetical protein
MAQRASSARLVGWTYCALKDIGGDALIRSTTEGYRNPLFRSLENRRRAPSSNWLALIGTVDRDLSQLRLRLAELSLTAPRTGHLCRPANDLPGGIDLPIWLSVVWGCRCDRMRNASTPRSCQRNVLKPSSDAGDVKAEGFASNRLLPTRLVASSGRSPRREPPNLPSGGSDHSPRPPMTAARRCRLNVKAPL